MSCKSYVCENCGESFKPNKQSEIYDNRFCDFDCRNGWFNGEQMKKFLEIVNLATQKLKC